MFTGLVQGTALVKDLQNGQSTEMTRLVLSNSLHLNYQYGDSIAVNGCCLTVAADSNEQEITFDISRETLARTNLGSLKTGSFVNLEQAMQLGQRLDGHLVSGHVDGLVTVKTLVEHPAGWLLQVLIPKEHRHLVIPKGSICLDGVSLTINQLVDSENESVVDCMLIPTTLEKTTLKFRRSGDLLNVEFDLMGKYFIRYQSLSGV